MHVLSTPPAFILSQDQTLMLKFTNGIVGWKFYKWVFVEKSRIKPSDLHALSWPSQLIWLSSGFFETGKLLSLFLSDVIFFTLRKTVRFSPLRSLWHFAVLGRSLHKRFETHWPNWLWVVSLFLLFSFQGSVCAAFLAANDILSLFHFSVKFFFSNIFFSERRTCLSSFDSEGYFNRKLFACQKLFSFFLCCFFYVSAANSMLSHRSRSVNNYFQFFGNFFTVFRQRNIYYHRFPLLSTLFMVLLSVHCILISNIFFLFIY